MVVFSGTEAGKRYKFKWLQLIEYIGRRTPSKSNAIYDKMQVQFRNSAFCWHISRNDCRDYKRAQDSNSYEILCVWCYLNRITTITILMFITVWIDWFLNRLSAHWSAFRSSTCFVLEWFMSHLKFFEQLYGFSRIHKLFSTVNDFLFFSGFRWKSLPLKYKWTLFGRFMDPS